MLQKIIITLLILFLLPSVVSAANYYADNQLSSDCPGTYSIANRDCSGSDGIAFNTIQEATETVAAGDIIYIRGGIYYEIVQHTDSRASQGTEGNYITYKVFQNENVTIDAQNDWTAFIIYKRDYIKVDGSGLDNQIHLYFKNADRVVSIRASNHTWFTHVDASGSPYNDGLKIMSDAQGPDPDDGSGSKYTIVEYSNFHGNGDYGIKLTGYNTSNNVIRYNKFYNNGFSGADGYGFQMSGGEYETNQPRYNEIYGNEFYGNYHSGIHLFESSFNKLWGNKFYDNGLTGPPGRGISISTNSDFNEVFGNEVYNNNYYGIEAYGSHSNRIYNNIIYDNAQDAVMVQNGAMNNEIYHNTIHGGDVVGIYLSGTTSGTIIKNNIIYVDGPGWVEPALYNSGGATATLDYNLWYDTTKTTLIYWEGSWYNVADFYTGLGQGQHSLQGDPLFEDVAARDFHLQSGSQARDSGTDLGISDDFEGTSRPQGTGWDMGAYESGSGEVPICEPNTYYIDFENGDDNNEGTCTTTPWKTLPGTRDVTDSGEWSTSTGWQQMEWGPPGSRVISYSEYKKISPGITIKLKKGTTHDSSNGGYIWIQRTFYEDATLSNPITITMHPDWGTGSVVFDGTGMSIPQAIIHIQEIDGITFDGYEQGGIVIQNSPLNGVRIGSSSYTVTDTIFRNVKFMNHGTSLMTDTDGAGCGHLHYKNTIGGLIEHVEFNGNKDSCGSGCFCNGFLGGESHIRAYELIIRNSIAHDLKGDLSTDDSGIGFKAQNSQITYLNLTSYNNLKGFDMGEHQGDGMDITYKIINCESRNNVWGINVNGAADETYSGTVNFYLINNIVRDNTEGGSNIYAGPYNLYAVHNIYENNGNPGVNYKYNIRVTSDGCTDESQVNAFLYNNIFYKPNTNNRGMNLQVGYIGDGTAGYDTNFNLDSDFNAWIQSDAGEYFCNWAFNACTGRATGITYSFYYDTNGPGHSSGIWYSEEGEPASGTGHLNCDANSKGTGADDSTEPSFSDVTNHDYRLTSSYAGTDLSLRTWYIPEMGIDRDGNTRTNWDMGAYEFTGSIPFQHFLPEQYIEAEDGEISAPMQIGTNSTASGSEYVFTDTGYSGSVTFTFDIQEAGRYMMDARILTPPPSMGAHDSFIVGLDNEPAEGNNEYAYDTGIETEQFVWDTVRLRGPGGDWPPEYDPMVWDLTSGLHNFTFYGREYLTQLDQIILKKAYHRSDTNTNGCIDTSEMIAFMNRWKLSSLDVPMTELMESITLWKAGTGCS